MGLILTRIQGENLFFKQGIEIDDIEQDLSGWECDIKIVKKSHGPKGVAELERNITNLIDDNKRFLIELLPADTKTLEPVDHWIIVELKSSDRLNSETHHTLTVEEEGI